MMPIRHSNSVMWPIEAGKARGEKRFFSSGGFFTDDRHAHFIAPESPTLRTAADAIYPLCLNTGRVRDQWHTMTRTGKSPRLGAHIAEPFVEINPTDANATGVADGGFAKVTTRHGATILKVVVTPGQRRGSLFAPIHWSDATASHARVDEMATSHNDPYSGQPELKATPARIEPLDFAYRGFALTRQPLPLPAGTWFARQAVAGGAGLLFATREPPTVWRELAQRVMPAGADIAEYVDERRGLVRIAAFRDGRLDGCMFVGPPAVLPSWDVVRGLFEVRQDRGTRPPSPSVRFEWRWRTRNRPDRLRVFRRRPFRHSRSNRQRRRSDSCRYRQETACRHQLRFLYSGTAGDR